MFTKKKKKKKEKKKRTNGFSFCKCPAISDFTWEAAEIGDTVWLQIVF